MRRVSPVVLMAALLGCATEQETDVFEDTEQPELADESGASSSSGGSTTSHPQQMSDPNDDATSSSSAVEAPSTSDAPTAASSEMAPTPASTSSSAAAPSSSVAAPPSSAPVPSSSAAPPSSSAPAPSSSAPAGYLYPCAECGEATCGTIPTECGVIECRDCSMPGEICFKFATNRHQTRVHNAVSAVINSNPEYFDVNDSVGGGVKVVNLAAYRAAVVAHVDGDGNRTAIADPNDEREIRVKFDASQDAENYLIMPSHGYTAYKYTSTCNPPGF